MADSYAYQRRQEKRDNKGHYENMHECEGCGKRIGADYYSDPRVNTTFHGEGLILCGRCCDHIYGLSDADALDYMANKRGKKQPKSKQEQIEEAYRKGNNWLYLANIAGERGDHELEQRHLERAQKWLDKLNLLEGYS